MTKLGQITGKQWIRRSIRLACPENSYIRCYSTGLYVLQSVSLLITYGTAISRQGCNKTMKSSVRGLSIQQCKLIEMDIAVLRIRKYSVRKTTNTATDRASRLCIITGILCVSLPVLFRIAIHDPYGIRIVYFSKASMRVRGLLFILNSSDGISRKVLLLLLVQP